MDTLTPNLTSAQLMQNIDAMKGQISDGDIQSYVDNYKADGTGGYVLASQQTSQNTTPTDNRNIIQKIGGAIYDPLVTMAARPGQLLGEGIAGIASKVTGNPQYYQNALDTANQSSQMPFWGTNIKPINQETPESVGGEALGSVALGVGSPLVGGALLAASSAMQDNGSPVSVAVNAVVGSLLGKGGEVVLKAAIPVISKIISKYGSEAITQFKKALPEYAKPALNKIIATVETKTGATISPIAVNTERAIQDVTPAYSPKIIGESGIKVQEGGIVKGRTVVSSKINKEAGTELANTKSYDPNATNLDKYNAVTEKEIPSIGKTLDTSLENEHILRPPKEIMSVVKKAVTEASQNSLLLQKTDPIVVNYLRVADRAISKSDGTLAGEWKVRKILDQAYEDAGGKYGNNKGLDQIHRASRNALLEDMESKAVTTEVKASMKQMTNLYNASDTLLDKAKAEGGSSWERFTKKHPATKYLLKIAGEGAGLGGVINLAPHLLH